MVAITRCDSKNINEYQNTVQDYERHPPRKSGDQLKELADLQDIVQGLAQERGVLDAVCAENFPRAKFYTQIAAVEAWAYALASDMAIDLGPACPTAGNVIPNQLLASGWFVLAGSVAENGGAAPSVQAIIPKVQTRADKINFKLPVFADTSNYWVDTVKETAKAALIACNLPVTTPSPSPTPIPTPF
ncbi:MAG TPA: hypothetical protein VK760_07725 [Candidatus Acidoferrales bacterium]|nr:hypothetical protein [Candidatus Acidoferrales bacterium]